VTLAERIAHEAELAKWREIHAALTALSDDGAPYIMTFLRLDQAERLAPLVAAFIAEFQAGEPPTGEGAGATPEAQP